MNTNDLQPTIARPPLHNEGGSEEQILDCLGEEYERTGQALSVLRLRERLGFGSYTRLTRIRDRFVREHGLRENPAADQAGPDVAKLLSQIQRDLADWRELSLQREAAFLKRLHEIVAKLPSSTEINRLSKAIDLLSSNGGQPVPAAGPTLGQIKALLEQYRTPAPPNLPLFAEADLTRQILAAVARLDTITSKIEFPASEELRDLLASVASTAEQRTADALSHLTANLGRTQSAIAVVEDHAVRINEALSQVARDLARRIDEGLARRDEAKPEMSDVDALVACLDSAAQQRVSYPSLSEAVTNGLAKSNASIRDAHGVLKQYVDQALSRLSVEHQPDLCTIDLESLQLLVLRLEKVSERLDALPPRQEIPAGVTAALRQHAKEASAIRRALIVLGDGTRKLPAPKKTKATRHTKQKTKQAKKSGSPIGGRKLVTKAMKRRATLKKPQRQTRKAARRHDAATRTVSNSTPRKATTRPAKAHYPSSA
ncbi:MAG: hypothetical protein OSA97_05895 [Nevskia sp.]|nr:hypothetical protein [Nevskia sp.]